MPNLVTMEFGGKIYDIKDAIARDQIADLNAELSSATNDAYAFRKPTSILHNFYIYERDGAPVYTSGDGSNIAIIPVTDGDVLIVKAKLSKYYPYLYVFSDGNELIPGKRNSYTGEDTEYVEACITVPKGKSILYVALNAFGEDFEYYRPFDVMNNGSYLEECSIFKRGYVYDITGTEVNVNNNQYGYYFERCHAGDKYVITSRATQYVPPYMFLNSNGIIKDYYVGDGDQLNFSAEIVNRVLALRQSQAMQAA